MTMLSDLPEDLVEEILSRVPARSLKRLRSTCKKWNALFNDHRFTKKHFDKAAKEFLVLMLRTRRVYSMSVKLSGIHNNIDPVIEVKGELGLLDYHNFEIFHCNGLLLCTISEKPMKGSDRLVVYNPCMGQTRWIGLRTVYKASDKFALGYKENKSCCDSYKILRFPGSCYNPVFGEFEIYEFNSDSWRVLDDVTQDWHLAVGGRGVSYKGNTYWIASDNKELVDDFLLEFDFTKERFRRLRLPFKGCYYDTVELSTVREEKLAVLFQSEDEERMEIWLINKIDEEPNDVPWRKFFAVDLELKYMFFFAMSFLVDEENKVAVCCDTYREEGDNRANVCTVREDAYRKVELLKESADEPYDDEPFLFSYVPSLVHI